MTHTGPAHGGGALTTCAACKDYVDVVTRHAIDVAARNVKYDLCDRCTMPRKDRHHLPGYRMDRSPYDIPGHAFVAPGDLDTITTSGLALGAARMGAK